MEYSKSQWDIFLLPRAWHKRLNAALPALFPGFIIVGLFDMLISPRPILNDFILASETGTFIKIVLFLIFSCLIGVLDVFCFGWPIADLCRYLAKRSEKFIVKGFNIILMKSYAYSYLFFIPLLLLKIPSIENIGPGSPFIAHLFVNILLMVAYAQIFWQLAIMLRTLNVKSKLELPGKIIVCVAMFIWFGLVSEAITYLTNVTYQLFANISGYMRG
jgi:hypothetical protein